MGLRSGLLNEVVTLKEPQLIKGDFGGNTTIYTPTITTRARVIHNAGARNIDNDEMVWDYTRTFTIRYYHIINDNWIIEWKGEEYRIMTIDRDREHQQMTIKATKVNE